MSKTRTFKTEVKQLLQLMIHSLYSNRDIFLRELIANAADAIDKARFASLTDPASAREWKIVITPDKEAKTLTIADNGVGMTEDEVVDNIGTIAKSGTKAFLKMLEEKGESSADVPELIGQFGVGFYSAFMVAAKVELITRSGDAPAVKWTSDGQADYTLAPAEKDAPAANTDKAAAADKKAAPAVAGDEYVVRSGDTLGKIAQKFYGDARRSDVLIKANPAIAGNPDVLRIGMKLVIPKI